MDGCVVVVHDVTARRREQRPTEMRKSVHTDKDMMRRNVLHVEDHHDPVILKTKNVYSLRTQ